MRPSDLRDQIQILLKQGGFYDGPIDGDFGLKTYAALRELDVALDGTEEPLPPTVHRVKASSFADPADIRSFNRCKAKGGSDQQCFKVGDNGIGVWGDDTTTDVPMCALPRDVWTPIKNPRGKKVIVEANGRQIVCELRDTMPRLANIKNGAGIDLNPAAVLALGMKVPLMTTANWRWA